MSSPKPKLVNKEAKPTIIQIRIAIFLVKSLLLWPTVSERIKLDNFPNDDIRIFILIKTGY